MDWNNDGKKDLVAGDSSGYVTIYINSGKDDKPEFQSGTHLTVGQEEFKAKNRAKPEIVDWNNDQLFDLIVGEESGSIYLFLNEGESGKPKFNSYQPLTIGGKTQICAGRGDPTVCDWNEDGKKDLLIGDESGKVLFYENKGSDNEPSFEGAVTLKAIGWPVNNGDPIRAIGDINGDNSRDAIEAESNGKLSYVINRSKSPVVIGKSEFQSKSGIVCPRYIDWNGDGITDLLIAEANGDISIALNTGSKTEAKFEKLEKVKAGRKAISAGKNAMVNLADFDKDGKFDILCFPEKGEAVWYRNIGKPGEPDFKEEGEPEMESSEINGGYRARIDVTDWNGDGKLDLLYSAVFSSDNKARVFVFTR